MEILTHEQVRSALQRISGSRCVQAWTGHGNSLFAGFGQTLITAKVTGFRGTPSHIKPPFELQTNLADWALTDISGSRFTSDFASVSEIISPCMIGRTVSHLDVNAVTLELTVVLDSIVTISIMPYSDKSHKGRYAWLYAEPENNVTLALIGGRFRRSRSDEPLYPQRGK